MQAKFPMERLGIRRCSSQLLILVCNISMVWLFNACQGTEEVRAHQDVNPYLEKKLLNVSLTGDYGNNARVMNCTRIGLNGEPILQISKVLPSGQFFCYNCLSRRKHATFGHNPRWPGSRRLLVSKQSDWYCRCTCIFYKLRVKPQLSSCKLQYIWPAIAQPWHTTNQTNLEPIPEQKCSALILIAALLGVACLGLLALLCIEKRGREAITNETIKQRSVRATLRASLPEEISFRTLRKITNNFNHILGDGGFGLVYNGEFKDGSKVAVKVLDRSMNQGEKEFKAEVVMMATTQHMNVMSLRGFCSEKTHRILVYDFMPNSSLDKWIFRPSGKRGKLDWPVRFSIAVGTARGLTYLHEECSQPIIHLDVKPENILLDDDFTPKLADFGLSRLTSRNQSRIVTKTRGTPGYLAPEWVQCSCITAKVDVYSFGMVLLELVCGREVINMGLGPEQWYLPAWVVHMVEEGRTLDIVDQLILEEVQYFYEDQVRRTIEVALCCIQEDPTLRPRMSRAVQMLEGVVEPKSPVPTKRIVTNLSSTKLKAKMNAYMDAIAEGISDISLENSERSSQVSSGQRSGPV
ncbi:hypothetical protein O6H91_05G054500 [Diphasiastrum complanatum]|uniref:Uncharacterized protein n=3 Tax=Diphasiastrum complanatum TaxID=34168 RepID=A0ACC2DNU7_DIPCM|nr:hypothetical protein O6H91_05G054500 [Diphasiastrum complanatum]KAJ7555773.1 hypothetical protein O6H91_05G054500 [Diphasiastrum complanatum]KAJ7555775.1 hypothetical protein O6H91_05G054500 [Diphasiastrum complanatum]